MFFIASSSSFAREMTGKGPLPKIFASTLERATRVRDTDNFAASLLNVSCHGNDASYATTQVVFREVWVQGEVTSTSVSNDRNDVLVTIDDGTGEIRVLLAGNKILGFDVDDGVLERGCYLAAMGAVNASKQIEAHNARTFKGEGREKRKRAWELEVKELWEVVFPTLFSKSLK